MTPLDPARIFIRRDPQGGDPGDAVRVVGVIPEYIGGEFLHDALVVESVRYGEVPAEWATARVSYTVDEFVAEYREADAAYRTTLHAEAVIASKTATATSEERQSPWAYVAPVQRRAKAARR